MIEKCNSIEQENSVFEYIGNNYGKCLYLYLDLKKYTIKSDKISAYIQTDGIQVRAVLLVYYSCLHLYSEKDDFDAVEICKFLSGKNITTVYCTESSALKLSVYMDNDISLSVGWVSQIKNMIPFSNKIEITSAKEKDFSQIAHMIYEDDDIGRNYKYEDLIKQLSERVLHGFSRNYVIKDGETVIAHACTNAETENIAVVGELMVKNEYRRHGYGSMIWSYLCDKLLTENKEVYSFYYSSESRRLHHKIGFIEICNWAKILINR